jgi:energy-coupling factor transporter ATP-binding protein EcfA2
VTRAESRPLRALALGVLIALAGVLIHDPRVLLTSAVLGAALAWTRGRSGAALVVVAAVLGAWLSARAWDRPQLLLVGARFASAWAWARALAVDEAWSAVVRLWPTSSALRLVDELVLGGRAMAHAVALKADAARARGLEGPGWARVHLFGRLVEQAAGDALDTAIAREQVRALRIGASAAPSSARAVARTAPTAEVALRLDHVTLERAGSSTVCGPYALALAPGEWVVLLGASGSGKTTLLSLAAGLQAPTRGVVRVGDVGVDRPTSAVALLMAQSADMHLASRVIDDVALGPLYHGAAHEDAYARARSALEDLALTHLTEREVATLSLGESRRVSLAALLVTRPRVLLLDEPTTGLDPVAQDHLLRAVSAAADAGTAVLWATHDLHTLPPRATRALVLDHGQVVLDGPVADALTPQTLRSAHLLRLGDHA